VVGFTDFVTLCGLTANLNQDLHFHSSSGGAKGYVAAAIVFAALAPAVAGIWLLCSNIKEVLDGIKGANSERVRQAESTGQVTEER
jgi:hypothetical protein